MGNELSTRDKIIREATQLLRHRSYNSFSYSDISDAIGIKKASIHYHFQTKEILGVAIIRNFRSKIEYLTKKLDKSMDDPIQKLEEYFDYFKEGLEHEKRLICPAGVFSVEFNTLPKEIQVEVRKLFDYYIQWLGHILEDGRQRGLLDFEETPEQKAIFIASLLEGSLVYTRSSDNIQHFNTVVDQLKRQIMV